MELQQLRTFIQVAASGNMTIAAQALHTVQSNVTAKLKKLEYELGGELFIRSRRGIRLTEKGERLLPYAQRLLALEQEAREHVQNEEVVSGQLRIASVDSMVRTLLAPMTPSFLQAYPQVQLELSTGSNHQVLEQLHQHHVHLAGIISASEYQNEPDTLDTLIAYESDLVLLGGDEQEMPEKLLILGNECFFAKHLIARFPHTQSISRISSVESILMAVAAGLGVTLLPSILLDSLQVPDGISQVRLTETCHYRLVKRADTPMSAVQQAFIQHQR